MSGNEGTGVIEVPMGGTFVISLPSVPTTGYTWEPDYEPGALDLVRGNDVRGLGEGVGAGGTEEFEFRATAPGTTVVTLRYRRPWSADPKDTRAFEVRVVP